jgi:hypothetical protein
MHKSTEPGSATQLQPTEINMKTSTRHLYVAGSLLLLAIAGVANTSHAQTLAPSYNMTRSEFQAFRGEYELSTGEWMRIYSQRGRFFAKVGKSDSVELVAISPGTFVAPTNGRKFTFRQHTNGLVTEVALSTAAQFALNAQK